MEYRGAVEYILQFADFERTSAARREAEAFALKRRRVEGLHQVAPQTLRPHIAPGDDGAALAVMRALVGDLDAATGLGDHAGHEPALGGAATIDQFEIRIGGPGLGRD